MQEMEFVPRKFRDRKRKHSHNQADYGTGCPGPEACYLHAKVLNTKAVLYCPGDFLAFSAVTCLI